MAKRHQDTQLTKDAYEAEDERLAGGGPDSTVIPAVPADPEVMSRRTIKQPKSRFSVAGTTTPRPSFAFGSNPVSSTPETPAPTANGSSVGLFGATPATPAPKTPFAGFPTLNGGTPATPAQQSPTRSANPFASLSSTTPAGKPPTGLFGSATPAGLFGSTTPAGMPVTPAGQPLSGGSSTTFPVPEEKKDQAKDTATPKQIFGGVSDFNFPTPAAKKDEAGGAAKPKPIFGGVSPFKFSGPAAEKDSDADKPKPMFAGASPFNIPEPAAKKDSDAGKPQPTFGGVSAPNIFGGQDEAEKKVEEEKPANPFTGMFGSKATATPAATPTKPPATTSTPVPVGGGLFGNVASTASAGLFGSDAKIGDTKKADAGLFGSKSSGSPAPATGLSGSKPEEPSKTTSGGLFGAKAPISLNASSNTGDVNYPALPSASSTTTTSVMTNGSIVGNAGASIQFNAQVPAPQEDLTEVQREEFDRQYKLRTLNATFVQALQQAEVETADLRIAFREYEKLYEQIMQGTKRKEESQPNGTAFSPKRSKTDEAKPAASSAASLFGAIVDKNVGQPTASTTNESQPKPVFGGFKPQLNNTSTPEKPAVASSFFGNTFATPAPVTTKTSSTTPTPPKTTSTLFGAGGGAAVSAPAPVGGGLFSNLKPIISDQKDKGEEDSPQKPKSAGLLFGAKPAESSTAPPPFAFKAGNTATSENSSSGGLFGSPKPSGDQTWKPDTPIKFGGSSSGLFGSQSSTSSAPSQLFNFSSQSTAASTAPSEAPKAPFSFTGNTSLGPPQSLSRTASFDSSGISTPGAISDTSASASTSAGASTSNEPSDEVRADKVDMSGPGPGEENDEVLYSVRVAVYIKDDKNAMKKVAVGASRVLKDKASGKTRFLVRTEQGKVALNVRLQKEVDYKPFPDKHVILIPDFSGDKPKMYTVRAKEGSAVAELGKIIAEVKG